MKKHMNFIFGIIAFALCLFLQNSSVKAAGILELNTENFYDEAEQMTGYAVSGECDAGVLSIVIMMYDQNNQLVQMNSVPVFEDHHFWYSFAVPEGNYTVKVADYEGGPFASALVFVTKPTVCVHEFEEKVTLATCTEKGQITLVCKKCGEVSSDGKEILEALGHVYENGVCSVCKAKDPDYKPQTEVEVVTTKETQKVVDEIKNDIVNTISESIKAVKEELAASGEAVSAGKLIAAVKEVLVKSESKEIIAVVKSVTNETLEKVITAVTENKEISLVVVSKPVSAEEIKKTAKADADKIEKFVADKGAVAQYLDLEILIRATDAQGKVETLGTVDQPTKEVTFTLSIPENLKKEGRVFYIIRVHANGAAEELSVNVNADGTISFKTDKFSTYALAYADKPTQDLTPTPDPTPSQDTTTVVATTPEKVSPKTGDSNKVAEWSAIFAAGLGAMLVALKKKRLH